MVGHPIKVCMYKKLKLIEQAGYYGPQSSSSLREGKSASGGRDGLDPSLAAYYQLMILDNKEKNSEN